jgi:hypothetical protein
VAEAMSSEEASSLSGDGFKTLLTLFMMSMQNSLDSDSSDDSYFSMSAEMDMMSQLFLQSLTGSLAGDGEQSSLTQQMLASYAQNMADI